MEKSDIILRLIEATSHFFSSFRHLAAYCWCRRCYLQYQLLTLFVISSIVANTSIAQPTLQGDTDISTAGYYQLYWTDPGEDGFILQEATTPSFDQAKIIYTGRDTATVISGKPDGLYYYRVATSTRTPPQWSETVKVEVAHHPLSRAFLFFTMGVFVFIVILIVILKGNKQSLR